MHSRTSHALVTLSLVCLGAITLAACTSATTGGTSPSTQAPVSTSTAAPVTGRAASDEEHEFEPAARALSNVVVNVEIEQAFTSARGTQLIPVGNGSGVVIRPDGYILTNQHVVSGADNVDVDLGAKHVRAKIVGTDVSTDLAVIKVARTGLPTATIGDPAALGIGEWVLAVGSPFGLDHSVSAGIVSALNRATLSPDASSAAAYTNLIQTDASINPGNSGGALGTLDGKVVGINSITESPSGGSAGVGFAIPIDFAMSVADQLIRTGHAVHPYIGATVTSIDSHIAFELGLDPNLQRGALVQAVTPGSPGQRAGLQFGDVITSLGGVPVTDAATYWEALRAQRIGATVPIVVTRNGRSLTIQVRIGSGPQG